MSLHLRILDVRKILYSTHVAAQLFMFQLRDSVRVIDEDAGSVPVDVELLSFAPLTSSVSLVLTPRIAPDNLNFPARSRANFSKL